MLDRLTQKLPEGLSISKVKGGARSRQIKIWFVYKETEVLGYLPTSCAPGYEDHVCDMTICNAMLKIGLERVDKSMVRVWNEKMNALCES